MAGNGIKTGAESQRKEMSEDDIYEDAMDLEKRPRRRHTRAELREIRSALKKYVKYGNEREFMQFLRGIGVKDESPRFAELVALFRSLRSGRP
jgi:hypothetical protein